MPGTDGALRILVAGGSIGGLSAGVALHGAGFDVQVHERHPGPMETRGAGIVVQGELLQLLRENGAPPLPTTSCSIRRYLDPQGGDGHVERASQAFTSWEAIYGTLRATLPADRYHMSSEVSDFEEHLSGSPILVASEGQSRIEVDVLVCADGAQSGSRRRLLPDVTSSYAGYVAWRGTLNEADAPLDLVRYFDDAFTFSEARSGGHILVYVIPGDGADTTPGKRRMNWVWYVTTDAAERDRLLVDRDGRSHHATLGQGEVPAGIIVALIERAGREVHPMLAKLVEATPKPFLQSIIDVVVPRMVFGRTCLLGDAAFVVRPHTAGASAKAARDASVLATSLKRARQDLDAGLGSFEDMQLEYGRGMSDYGIALGRRWAA